jgi:hypothetical protein
LLVVVGAAAEVFFWFREVVVAVTSCSPSNSKGFPDVKLMREDGWMGVNAEESEGLLEPRLIGQL